jgi:hypothetical protein
MRFRGCSTVLLLVLTLAIPATAQRISKGGAASAGTIRVDLSRERAGREPTKFLAVVGNWTIVDEGGKRVLGVDGRSWLRGQPAGSLAERFARFMARATKSSSTT